MRLLMGILTFFLVTTANAVNIRGMGTHNCGQYIEFTTGDQADTYKQLYYTWVWGFMSGASFFGPKEVDPPEAPTVVAFLDNFCRRNPLLTVTSGTLALAAELGGPRTKFPYQK